MKILYVTHFSPWNPKYGAAMRSFGILKGLRQNHEVHVALASDEGQEIENFALSSLVQDTPDGQIQLTNVANQNIHNTGVSLEDLPSTHPASPRETTPARGPTSGLADEAGKQMLSDYPFRYILKPDHVDQDREPDKGGRKWGMQASFLKLVGQVQPDLIWYFTKYSLRRVGFATGIPSVLDLDDVPWRKLLLMGKYQRGFTKLLTLLKVFPSWLEDYWLTRRASTVVITNPEEANLLKLRKPVIPVLNGFDFPEQLRLKPRLEKRILFFGSLFYYPNLDGIRWFYERVWPQVRAEVPEASLDVIGLYHRGLERLENMEGVNLLGFVEDLDCYIARSAFLVVPLRIASGTRIKIIEAWAKGLPVVSTTLGAEGLGARNNENILIGDTSKEMAQACIRLLKSPDDGIRLAHTAFGYAKTRFSWENIYPTLEKVLSTAARR